MSIDLLAYEIKAFLLSKEPQVICIRGRWGIGKTFAWNRFLSEAQRGHEIGLDRYSYVSLFGVNSLEEFKYSIFENTVSSSIVGVEPSLETLQTNTAATVKRLTRKSAWFFQQLPMVKNYLGGLGPVCYMSVKSTIVCIDDVERRGANLDIRDVLGLASSLKEQKKCKVVLILNDEAMDKDKIDFERYFEKVIDVSLIFAPSAEESVKIAIDDGPETNRLLAQRCVDLGISNIRIIKKVERSIRLVAPLLRDFDSEILKQAIHTLTLLTWSIYETDTAPPFEYVLKRGKTETFLTDQDNVVSPQEAAWNAMLDAYGFGIVDEFDLALAEGIKRGYFDRPQVHRCALELNKLLRTQKLSNSFTEAWKMFHDSFASDEKEVLDNIYQSTLDNLRNISPNNLNATVELFKVLNRSPQASKILNSYMEQRGEEKQLFDLNNYSFHFFADQVTDPDVIAAFKKKLSEFKTETNASDILLSIAEKHGWNKEDISTLEKIPVEGYYKIFKENSGERLRKLVNACLQFGTIQNASSAMLEISQRAKQALALIGKESHMNALRVKKYGVG